MTGKLYGIGVGPGDPELLTLKAKRILDMADVIAVPVKEAGEASTALEIIRPVVKLSGRECMEVVFQMHPDEEKRRRCRQEACQRLTGELAKGKTIAMITLGDVSVYSTYMYVNQYVAQAGFDTEIVPGIPSFCSGAAAAQLSLMEGNESLAIVPSARETKNLAVALDHFENVHEGREQCEEAFGYAGPAEDSPGCRHSDFLCGDGGRVYRTVGFGAGI